MTLERGSSNVFVSEFCDLFSLSLSLSETDKISPDYFCEASKEESL